MFGTASEGEEATCWSRVNERGQFGGCRDRSGGYDGGLGGSGGTGKVRHGQILKVELVKFLNKSQFHLYQKVVKKGKGKERGTS